MKKFNVFEKIGEIYQAIEVAILVIVFIILVLFSLLQIFFRIEWFDSVIKYTVLWLGLLGASLAVFEDKHIKIDILGRITKGKIKIVIFTLIDLFAAFVSILLAIGSIDYLLKVEIPSNEKAVFFNITKWQLLIILPVGFGVIGIKFLIKALMFIIKNRK